MASDKAIVDGATALHIHRYAQSVDACTGPSAPFGPLSTQLAIGSAAVLDSLTLSEPALTQPLLDRSDDLHVEPGPTDERPRWAKAPAGRRAFCHRVKPRWPCASPFRVTGSIRRRRHSRRPGRWSGRRPVPSARPYFGARFVLLSRAFITRLLRLPSRDGGPHADTERVWLRSAQIPRPVRGRQEKGCRPEQGLATLRGGADTLGYRTLRRLRFCPSVVSGGLVRPGP